MPQRIRIKAITPVARDVHQFRLEKPSGYAFDPGQAADLAVDASGWRDRKRPFTFTSLPGWDDLEFTIKTYHDRGGMTDRLSGLIVGDALLLDEPWGTIGYRGPGVFIAGGAGVTPFIAILRQLNDRKKLAGNRLIFANRREQDIILADEWARMPGLDVLHVLSQQDGTSYEHGHVDRAFLERHIDDFDRHFYVCGPDRMVGDVSDALMSLGAKPDALIFEK